MSTAPKDLKSPGVPRQALVAALEQSHEAKQKVEETAEDLSVATDDAKALMAKGATRLPAVQVLQTGLAVGAAMVEVADDLKEVTGNLADSVEELTAVELSLARSRDALAESEQALATSREVERDASQRAMHDAKTGLPNRSLFDDRLAQAIAGAERHGWMLAVMFLDLDRFKLVNDTHGHAAGDVVLSMVAQRLSRHARDEDTVCRNGGDEFLYLLINPASRDEVARLAGVVRRAIAEPVGVAALQFVVTPSIGIALYPEHGTRAEQLIDHADAAMYRAKSSGTAFEFHEWPAGAAADGAAEPSAARARKPDDESALPA